ncbi:MAG: hypothetical protein J6X79_08150 [Bacteroidales bacterium]|nr:hypothetical protein [Bacteroidales bacterium]
MRKAIVILGVLLVLAPCANAQMVGSTNRQQGGYYDPGYGQSDEGRQRGPLLHFELGMPFAFSLGYQLNPSLMVGAGVGASFLITEYAPIFAQIRLSTPHDNRALFLDIKGGYDLGDGQGIILLGQAGILFKNLGIAIGGGYSGAYNGSEALKFCLTISYDLFFNKILY